ncbi:MAG: class I SAM-dependent methyltransferase [Rhodopila sp.]|jgi:SAM-dependent methyltransferase
MPFRPDIERLRSVNTETRSPDRLRAHFEVERELAARLRTSRPDERGALYGDLYGELFARLPDHPQHKLDPAKRHKNTASQVAFLKPYLSPTAVFVEIGCGDAAVTRSVATFVNKAVGIDVTSVLIDHTTAPANFQFVHTKGVEFSLPTDYADIVYSNQLMEHLHPEDAKQQLQEIYRILKPDGLYICSTPSRLTGPHDISVYFGYEPTGFHMHEYDHGSLAVMFREVGFRSARAHFSIKGRCLDLPVVPVIWIERFLLALPQAIRTRLAHVGPIRNLAGVTLVGRK